MKKFAVTVAFFLAVAFLLPLAVHLLVGGEKAGKNKNDTTVNVYFTDSGQTRRVLLEDYLVGVVAAEMPAEFEAEALKAQAVAARSYILYKAETQNRDHPTADVCTDSTHCKAYKPIETAKKQWGKNAPNYERKIKNAVQSTRGEILTYDGKCCMAVFHSQAGGGRTESSADVWGGEVEYLSGVESHGEEKAPGFFSSVTVSEAEFKEKTTASGEVPATYEIGNVKRSDGGAVLEMEIGTQTYTGRQLRELFGLRSTCFTLKRVNGDFVFEVQGYGHGVGMSQYGANEMAKEGKTYAEILYHYYTNTQLNYV